MADILSSSGRDPVVQFSVFADNKVGRLHEVVALLAAHDVHLLGLSVQDTTDASIIRIIVDDPETARGILHEHGHAFSESPMVVALVETESQVRHVTAALVEVEMNIHYCYPLLQKPEGRYALALRVEDADLAETILSTHGLRVVKQGELSR